MKGVLGLVTSSRKIDDSVFRITLSSHIGTQFRSMAVRKVDNDERSSSSDAFEYM